MHDLPFVKMQATGNSFVLVDGHGLPELDWPALARDTADPHTAVGHDGLLVVLPSASADLRQRMFNPDGTEDLCGNGLRCTAKYAVEAGLAGEHLTIETIAGPRRAQVVERDSVVRSVRAEIGPPRVFPARRLADPEAWGAGSPWLDRSVLVEVGTPHLVIPALDEVTEAQWRELSAGLETEGARGLRVTVTWFAADGHGRFRARFWERSVGETLSCGTGTAAVLAAAMRLGLADRAATVLTRGGQLQADADAHGVIFVAGHAATVFTARWPLPVPAAP